MSLSLREYQSTTIETVRGKLLDGMRRILVVSPTGSGKTVMFASIIASAVKRGKRVLVVVHLQELVDQTISKLNASGITDIHVMRGNDKRRSDTALVTVASIQTLANREKPEADLVILDEAHRSLAASFANSVWSRYTCPILGWTATPCRTDGRGLGEKYESMVVAATYSQLIEIGFVASPVVYGAKEKPDMSKVSKGWDGDWNKGEMEATMKRLSGHIVPTWFAKAEGRSTIVFASGLDHSKDIVDRFIAAGVTAEHLDGTTPGQERKDILERLRTGETRVVSNCAVLTEGFDCPGVRCVVIARPTLSVIMHYQTSGRALRPGAVRPVIIDHAGNVDRHGMPHHDREWSLLGVASDPKEKNPFKQCKGCYAYVPAVAVTCPECGYEAPKLPAALPEETDVELVQLAGEPIDVLAEEGLRLYERAHSYGYQPKWIGMEWKKKHGYWPEKLVNEAVAAYREDEGWQQRATEQAKRREFWKSRKAS